MVQSVHVCDAGLRLVWPLNWLLLATHAAASAAATTISVALTTAAHLRRCLRGLLLVAAVL